jgi:hypothetical protein
MTLVSMTYPVRGRASVGWFGVNGIGAGGFVRGQDVTGDECLVVFLSSVSIIEEFLRDVVGSVLPSDQRRRADERQSSFVLSGIILVPGLPELGPLVVCDQIAVHSVHVCTTRSVVGVKSSSRVPEALETSVVNGRGSQEIGQSGPESVVLLSAGVVGTKCPG